MSGVLIAAALWLVMAPGAQAASALKFTATLNGRSSSSITSNSPLKLSENSNLNIDLKVTNPGSSPLTVDSVRIDGRVMGLSFFTFTTEIDMVVAPSQTSEQKFRVDLGDLNSQADGLLPTTFALLNTHGGVIASNSFPVDVRGKLTSIYGTFGLVVAALTLIWLISLVYRVAMRTLPENRWRRALQFCAAGFGVGFVLTFTVSATRLLTPDAPVWAPFVFGCAAVGLVIGYLTPGPRADDEDEDEQLRLAMVGAGQGQLYGSDPLGLYGDQDGADPGQLENDPWRAPELESSAADAPAEPPAVAPPTQTTKPTLSKAPATEARHGSGRDTIVGGSAVPPPGSSAPPTVSPGSQD